jgi:glycolate oxidase iron-sulfur subunit
LHRHDGFADRADYELNNTFTIFKSYDHVLTLASACLESLRLHTKLATKLDDATRFIASISWNDTFQFNTPPQTVWVHVPCSQRRTLGDPKAAINFLNRIPNITAIALPHNDVCCGAAGTYMLRQPVLSQSLWADKLKIIQTAGVTTLVTTNTGCALRFKAGLRNTGIKIFHPLEFASSCIVLLFCCVIIVKTFLIIL